MIPGSERKFHQLTPQQQHKRCADILRNIYQSMQSNEAGQEYLLQSYLQMLKWMGYPKIQFTLNPQNISDAFHLHLEKAGLALKEHNLLSPQRRGDRTTSSAPWPIDIYLDNLRSAHNVGSILRTVEAFALGNVFFSLQTPFIDNPKVQKTSMGTLDNLTCSQGITLNQLKKPIIALETCRDALNLFSFTFPESFTLVLGNEEYGCSSTTLEQADYRLEIPLRGKKNSLNVANAFASVATEIARQKAQG